MGSTRLPGKILLPLNSKGDSILKKIISTILSRYTADQIIVATSREPKDDLVADLAKSNNVNYHRGSENNVLERFYEVIGRFACNHVVRLTGDNPFVDIETLNEVLSSHISAGVDYSYSIGLPVGMNVEVISTPALRRTYSEATTEADFEHVTHYIRRNREDFKVAEIDKSSSALPHHLRLTVDTPEDYHLAKELVALSATQSCTPDISFLKAVYRHRPNLFQINQHVTQRS